MSQELFPQNFSEEHFEGKCKENGFTYWFASDLKDMLDYESWSSFSKAINKAMTTLNTLGIDIFDNIQSIQRIEDGKNVSDYKLSRLACYLVVMNADNKKKAVANAQVYFSQLAGAIQDHIEEASRVERINVRSEVSDGEKSLSGVAHQAGVENYGFFQNAGYRGMYNKNITQLKQIRGLDKTKTLLDFMGKEELAANLFRITQTELKIKTGNVKGQSSLEAAAHSVGKEVRSTMIKISGVTPENLPRHDDIKSVKKEIKSKARELKRIDKKKNK